MEMCKSSLRYKILLGQEVFLVTFASCEGWWLVAGGRVNDLFGHLLRVQ